MSWSRSLTAAGRQAAKHFRYRSLGGSKGIIVLDKSLRGRQLALRPSMLKFKAYFDDKKTSAYVLHIAESFSRPGTLHLSTFAMTGRLSAAPLMREFETPPLTEVLSDPADRPLVSALEDLGIAPKVFLGLQEFAIEDLLQEKTSLLGALSLLRRYE